MRPQSPFVTMLHNLWTQIVRGFTIVAKKLRTMDLYEQIMVIGVFVTLCILLCSPLVVISPNIPDVKPSYGYLLSLPFIKSCLILVIALVMVLLVFLHKKIKLFIIETLGFQGNKYLLIVFLLGIALASFFSLGESLALVADYTTVIQLTTMFYVIQILLIALLGYALAMILSSQHQRFRGHVVGYHGRKQETTSSHEGGLFEDIER